MHIENVCNKQKYIDISVFSVCMNVVISATIKATDINFGMKVFVYRAQIKFIINMPTAQIKR